MTEHRCFAMLKNEILEITVDPLGAQLKSLKKNGRQLLWQGDPKFWTDSSPVLFPICGGLKNDSYTLNGHTYSMEKHGFACNSYFNTVLSDEGLSFVLNSDDNTLKKYPYDFTFTVTYKLCGNAMTVDYRIENRSNTDMYFSLGSHDGYNVSGIENCELIFDSTESFETCILDGAILGRDKQKIAADGKVLPLKNEYFAIDALIFENVNSNAVTLHDKNTGSKIKTDIHDFENLLIWTVPNAPFVCIEPWSGFPDYSDTDGDFTKKNAIQRLQPHSEMTKTRKVEF